ncbi:MAG: hypothetical protein ACUVRL_11100 [Candidatus Saccharicenans sp.]|uniref:hypothetical protein n=1 Tax=Candidatus Saccharicenans sp. TaxID=2819258 RepID=UPI004049A5A2
MTTGCLLRKCSDKLSSRLLKVLIIVVFFVLSWHSGSLGLLASPAAIQEDEISRLTREAQELEGRATRLRVAVENCRRSITPQSPDCFIDISWLGRRVSWKEAERIAAGMEEQARSLRARIEYLKAQASQPVTPPLPPPVTQPPQTVTGSPPVSNNPPTGQNITTRPPAEAPKPSGQTGAPVTPSIPAPAPTSIAGFTESEWREYKRLQQEVDDLYSRVPLDDKEAIRFMEALKARNALWEKAVTRRGLTDSERKMLRLPIPVKPEEERAPKFPSERYSSLQTQRVPPPPFPADYSTTVAEAYAETGAQQAVDEFGKIMTERINLSEVDRGMLTAENVVGISKITMKLKQKDIPGAISETVDFIAGKVAAPIASMNVSVFKSVYSKVTHGLMENFFKETDRAMQELTGQKVEINQDEWYKDMNTGQKTVAEWIGWGELIRDKNKDKKRPDD